MSGLVISIATLADEIRTEFWSRKPYRHFEVGVTVCNEGSTTADSLSFEILFPQDIIYDENGSRWRPSHKHEIGGTVYIVWRTVGPFAERHATGSVSLPPNPKVLWKQSLIVNIKPYVQSAMILYRLFEAGDAVSDWLKCEIEFKPFSPHL